MTQDFYRAFEDKHRGSRELIKSRQRVYLPFIEPLRSIYDDAKVIDLGCGRGEWLELLKESGFNAYGVDLDDGMLAECRILGLQVATADAISTLEALSDESQVVVSGFHIVEHIEFSSLQKLVQEALRVLKPGGLLILETPNPENIVVGACNFYIDPSHQRPIPPQLLSFLPEYYGYDHVKILRLQESTELHDIPVINLMHVIGGVSPDYAVIAQKTGTPEIISTTIFAFEADYGLSLENLAKRYDVSIAAKAERAEAKAKQAEAKAEQAEAKAEQAQELARLVDSKILQVNAIYNSTSWRITAPLRWVVGLTYQLKAQALKIKFELLLQHGSLYIGKRPQLERIAIQLLKRLPGLNQRFKSTVQVNSINDISLIQDLNIEQANLNQRARHVYANLKAAIESEQKENS